MGKMPKMIFCKILEREITLARCHPEKHEGCLSCKGRELKASKARKKPKGGSVRVYLAGETMDAYEYLKEQPGGFNLNAIVKEVVLKTARERVRKENEKGGK
jgi:hypothetical protein